MKKIFYNKYIRSVVAATILMTTTVACNDFLDVTPPSDVSDADYLWTPDQLKAYVTTYYVSESGYSSGSNEFGGRLPSHYGSGGESPYSDDICTDIAVGRSGNSRYIKGSWTTPSTGSDWNFRDIRRMNYFINTVEPRYQSGTLQGDASTSGHYLGEAYFLRALQYFYRLRKLGDFPIITETTTDESAEALIEASKRQPRNEVARFILQDLDRAIALLKETAPAGGTTRISKNVAYLLKARVALYEASWETYHANTPFVPKATGWPGADKDYLAGYQFPSGSLAGEVEFFLSEAMAASQVVADKYALTQNNQILRSDLNKTINPYYDMFSSSNPGTYSEVLLWRQYLQGTVSHWFNHYLYGGGNRGWTKHIEKSMLMQNGLPYYDPASGYAGDDQILDTKTDRDWRWRLFMKAPGEVRAVVDRTNAGFASYEYSPSPARTYDSDGKNGTSTGYLITKGYSQDYADQVNGNGQTGSVIFRAAEAYLIYLEASYMKNGTIDTKADTYWKALRTRAGVSDNYQATIGATNMSTEAQDNWAAYSKGALVDATLYNIRRERGIELMGEGFRYDDLCRWRAMDQLNGFKLEGSKVWGPMYADYNTPTGNNITDNVGKTISEQTMSLYTCPIQAVKNNNLYYDGFFFYPAHYLNPIAVNHFLLSSSDGATVGSSPIYQNPGWKTEAGATPDYN